MFIKGTCNLKNEPPIIYFIFLKKENRLKQNSILVKFFWKRCLYLHVWNTIKKNSVTLNVINFDVGAEINMTSW